MPTRSGPALSIVVPVYARRRELGHLLASLEAQRPPRGGMEVVVVENRRPLNRRWLTERSWPFPLRHVFVPDGGPARNRNAGAAAARGERLFFVDSDVEVGPAPDILVAMDPHAPGPGPDAVRPDTVLMADVRARRDRPPTLASHLYDVPAYFRRRYRSASRQQAGLGFADFVSCSFSVGRGPFTELGGFDDGFVHYGYEDVEFALRAEAAGWALRLAPVSVRHDKRLGPASVLARASDLGRSATHFVRLHPDIERRMPLGVRDTLDGRLSFPHDFDVRPLLARAAAVERRIGRLRRSPQLREAVAAVAEGQSVYRQLALYGRYCGIRDEIRGGLTTAAAKATQSNATQANAATRTGAPCG